jgi:Extracellular tail, of 10TM putative phosphate transporter
VEARSEEVPRKVDAPSPILLEEEVIKAIDFANASASGSSQRPGEGESPDSGVANSRPLERAPSPTFTDESRSSSPSPSAKSVEDEGPTDFSHPAAVEEQRIIWLPKDRLGLIDEIMQDLAAWDISHSTDGAEMDDKGHVDVTMAPPEDVQRNQMEPVPLPSPDEGEGDEIRVAQFEGRSPERSKR